MDSYVTERIDVRKDCLSTPGISRILLMRSAQKQNILFPLMDEADKDLFYMFKAQIVAGPSIVFTRDLHANHTQLFPDSEQLCKKILGYDCNSLYLAQMLHSIPSQSYVRRHREEGFYPKHKQRYIMMYIWLEYRSRLDGVHIRSRLNQGFECKVGSYYVDGFSVDNDTLTIYEYKGCYFHAHSEGCRLNIRRDEAEMKAINERDAKREQWFSDNGYRCEVMWECDMLELLKCHPEMKQRYKSLTPKFYNNHPNRVSEKKIIEAIKRDEIFGFFVVDIHTPTHLQAKFERYPPLFGNNLVRPEDVGE
jgi:G:T-mismatch repair DNA endonuclease (very short patch repair protein)